MPAVKREGGKQNINLESGGEILCFFVPIFRGFKGKELIAVRKKQAGQIRDPPEKAQ